jgi:hypothetical protein
MKAEFAILLAVSASLAGCSTGYHARGFAGGLMGLSGGYEEFPMSRNVYRITFKGNGYTSKSRAQALALLRAADLTLENGFTHFILLSESDASRSINLATPQQAVTTGTANFYGDTAYLNATTTTTGGYSTRIDKPGATIIIRMTNEDSEIAMDATFARDFIRREQGL